MAALHRTSADLVAALVKLRTAVGTLQSGQPLDPMQRREVVPAYFKALTAFHDALIEALEVEGSFIFDDLHGLQDAFADALGAMDDANERALPRFDDERLGAQQLGVGAWRR